MSIAVVPERRPQRTFEALAAPPEPHLPDPRLKAFLEAVRQACTPPAGRYRGRRSTRYLTQAQMAALLGVTPRWYQAMESGRVEWTIERTQQVAQVCDLGPGEAKNLYRLALGVEPMATWDSRADPEEQLIELAEASPYPVAVIGPLTQTLYTNTLHRAMLPQIARWETWAECTLLDPSVREVMVDWRQAWAEPMISDIRHKASLVPTQERQAARRLLTTLRAGTPDLAESWRSRQSAACYLRSIRSSQGQCPVHRIDIRPASAAPFTLRYSIPDHPPRAA